MALIQGESLPLLAHAGKSARPQSRVEGRAFSLPRRGIALQTRPTPVAPQEFRKKTFSSGRGMAEVAILPLPSDSKSPSMNISRRLRSIVHRAAVLAIPVVLASTVYAFNAPQSSPPAGPGGVSVGGGLLNRKKHTTVSQGEPGPSGQTSSPNGAACPKPTVTPQEPSGTPAPPRGSTPERPQSQPSRS